jgi:outer membrane lipoprotein-sorting protein
VDVQNASVAAMSGTVVQTADLGLPDLPVQMGGRASSDFTSLVSGTHTLKVWYDGDDQQRLALLGTLGESDVIRNGSDVWTWSSQDNAATHYQLPTRPDGSATPDPSVPAYTPQQAADAALAAIDPSTNVSTDGTASVAGRAAYELVLTPKDDRSLIGEVRIAIDGEQHIPLQVEVTAKGAAAPAFQVGFTQISFDTPDAAQFTFTPPPGATVNDSTLGQSAADGQAQPDLTRPEPTTPAAEPTVVGTGWTSVLVANLPTAAAGASPTPATPPTSEATTDPAEDPAAGPGAGSELQSILGSLQQVSGTWGSGRLLQSALFSVLITDDGRVIAGAVSPELLYQAAGQ